MSRTGWREPGGQYCASVENGVAWGVVRLVQLEKF